MQIIKCIQTTSKIQQQKKVEKKKQKSCINFMLNSHNYFNNIHIIIKETLFLYCYHIMHNLMIKISLWKFFTAQNSINIMRYGKIVYITQALCLCRLSLTFFSVLKNRNINPHYHKDESRNLSLEAILMW